MSWAAVTRRLGRAAPEVPPALARPEAAALPAQRAQAAATVELAAGPGPVAVVAVAELAVLAAVALAAR